MKTLLFVSFLAFVPLSLLGQPLIFVDGVELEIDSSISMYIEGGVHWTNGGKIRNQGKVYLGRSKRGFNPLFADWYQDNATLSGNIPGIKGMVHFTGSQTPQRIWGADSLVFSQLVLDNYTEVEGILSLDQLHLDSASLLLHERKLYIRNPAPSGITTSHGGGILGDTHPLSDGGYTQVIWDMEKSSEGQRFTVPYLTQEGTEIPFQFTLDTYQGDPVHTFTYPTNTMNEPYPIELEGIGEVQHMLNSLGQDFSGSFVDRFWYLGGGRNTFSGVHITFDSLDISADIRGKKHLLGGQWWNGGKWTYYQFADSVGGRSIGWSSPLTSSGIWSLSLSRFLTHTPHNLETQHFQIFPNPSEGLSRVSLSLASVEKLSFRLYDTAGRIIWERDSSELKKEFEFALDLRAYSPGLYHFVAYSGKQRAQRKILLR